MNGIKMKIFSVPLNPRLNLEQFQKFYSLVEKYKDWIYDIYFTTRTPPFVQDAMGDVFDEVQAQDLIHNSMVFQTQLGIPLSATYNNIEVPPREDLLDMWIENFRPLYEQGIRTVTLPHTIWLLNGKIKQEFPDLFIKNTILRNVQRPNEVIKCAEAGFDYVNLDRDLMRDKDQLLRIKKAKEYIHKNINPNFKLSLLANEHCWGNCPVQDEHFQYNNTRQSTLQPTYFMTELSKFSCPAWDRDDPGHVLKKANFSPWREDWLELYDLGIDVFKMHGRENAGRLFETMEVVKNFAEGKEIVWDNYQDYLAEMNIDGSPINIWREKIKNCKFDCWDCNYCDKVVSTKTRDRFKQAVEDNLNAETLGQLVNAVNKNVDARYLEINAGEGNTFVEAMEGNTHTMGAALDNYSVVEIMDNDKQVTPTSLKTKLYKNLNSKGIKNFKTVDCEFNNLTKEELTYKPSVIVNNSVQDINDYIKQIGKLFDQTFVLFDVNDISEALKENLYQIKYSNKYNNYNIYVVTKF